MILLSAIVLFRTFVDANDPSDIKVANALQDKIAVRQKSPGKFETPDWDEASLKKVRDAVNVLAATRTIAKGMFGDKAKLDPISHLLGTAFGWGLINSRGCLPVQATGPARHG
jgi:hypothetical protein